MAELPFLVNTCTMKLSGFLFSSEETFNRLNIVLEPKGLIKKATLFIYSVKTCTCIEGFCKCPRLEVVCLDS